MKASWLKFSAPLPALAQNPPPGLLFIDPLLAGGEQLAQEFCRRSLCLAAGAENCHCKGCHLFAQGNHPDFLHCGGDCKMAELRELLAQLQRTPLLAARRLVWFRDVHLANENVLNALLKSLEEPPPASHFVLTAPNRRAVKATILSRCQLHLVPQPSNEEALAYVADGRRVARQVARELLDSNQNNPYRAYGGEIGPNPDESIAACVALLCRRSDGYLSQLDQLPGEVLNDYVGRQIAALIQAKQLAQVDGHWPRLASLNLDDLDLNQLHTLYARLQALRRPGQGQMNRSYAVKALLIEYNAIRTKL